MILLVDIGAERCGCTGHAKPGKLGNLRISFSGLESHGKLRLYSQTCIPVIYRVNAIYRAIGQVNVKSYLPGKKICLSWKSSWDFFRTLHRIAKSSSNLKGHTIKKISYTKSKVRAT